METRYKKSRRRTLKVRLLNKLAKKKKISEESQPPETPSTTNSNTVTLEEAMEVIGEYVVSQTGAVVTDSESIRFEEIDNLLGYGSEEEVDSDDNTEDVMPALRLPSAFRILQESLDDEEMPVDATVCYTWPPVIVEPVPDKPDPLPTPPTKHQGPTMFDFNWTSFPDPPLSQTLRREHFKEEKYGPIASYADPYEAFVAIWDRPIMEYIAAETNKYARQMTNTLIKKGELRPSSRINAWKDTNSDELYRYFAITLATGTVIKSRLNDYWDTRKDIFSTPGFSIEMSYNRFILLSRCLHFNDNASIGTKETQAQAKLYKIEPIINHLNKKFSELYVLDQNITVDKSLIQMKGCHIDQHTSYATGVGIKTHELYESQTGYLWRFEVCTGKDPKPPEDVERWPMSGKIPSLVLRLLRGLEFSGRTVWMDSYYNSPALARQLKALGLDCAGSLRLDRQFIPETMRSGKFYGCTTGDVDIIVWRHVGLITTYHGAFETKSKERPIILDDYNSCMGGLDKKDQILATFPVKRHRIWYKNFFRRLLNMSVFNAYIIFKGNRPNSVGHHDFRAQMIGKILDVHEPLSLRPAVSEAKKFLVKIPADMRQHVIRPLPFLPRGRERARKQCTDCKIRTTFECADCKKCFCKSCFHVYHKYAIR